MEAFKQWLTEQIVEKKVEPNSGLGEAIAYFTKHFDKLTLFLRVAGAPLDNNICNTARGISNIMPTSRLCRVRVGHWLRPHGSLIRAVQ